MLNDDVCRKTSGNVASRNALRPRQVAALEILVSGGNMTEAAKAAGISPRTLERWLTRPEFSGTLQAMQTTMLKSITSRLTGLAGKAVDTLAELLSGEGVSDAIKARVAVAALDSVMKWHQGMALEERLATLEKEVTRIPKLR